MSKSKFRWLSDIEALLSSFGHRQVAWSLAMIRQVTPDELASFYDIKVNRKMTPLMLAAQGGMTAVIADLCDRGVAVDEQVPGTNTTALIIAVEAGRAGAVRMLLSYGANCNDIPHPNGILLQPILAGEEEVLALLLDAGANQPESTGGDDFLLYAASGHIDDRMVKVLLARRRPNPNWMTRTNMCALYSAVTDSTTATVGILLDYGAKLNVLGPFGDTMVEAARIRGSHEMAAFLLDHGALEITDERAAEVYGPQYRARIRKATVSLVGEPTHEEAAALEAMNDVPRLKAMYSYIRHPGRTKVSWRRVLATKASD